MPNLIAESVSVVITAATAAALTCADTSGLFIGQRGWAVKSGGTDNLEVIVVEVLSSTQFSCQTITNINSGGNADLSLYNGGTFYFEKQLVEVPGGGSDLSTLDTISVGKVPAKTATGFVNATLDNVPDSSTRKAATAAEKIVLAATTALNSGEVPAKTAGGSVAAATTANVPASTDKNYVTDAEKAAAGALAARSIRAATGTTDTLLASDAGLSCVLVDYTHASGCAVTLDKVATVAYPVAGVISVRASAAGDVVITPTSPATINGAGTAVTVGSGTAASLIHTAENVWKTIPTL